MSDMGWRDKDDLDLTSEDISAMAAEGEQLFVRGPKFPGGARVIGPPLTEVAALTVSMRAPVIIGGGMRVVHPVI